MEVVLDDLPSCISAKRVTSDVFQGRQSAAERQLRPLSARDSQCRPISAVEVSVDRGRDQRLYGCWAETVSEMRARAVRAQQQRPASGVLEAERAERARRCALVEAERREANARALSDTARAERRLQDALEFSRDLDKRRFAEAERRKEGLSRYWLRSSNLWHNVESVRVPQVMGVSPRNPAVAASKPARLCAWSESRATKEVPVQSRAALKDAHVNRGAEDDDLMVGDSDYGWSAVANKLHEETPRHKGYSVEMQVENLRSMVDYSVDESEHYGVLADGQRAFKWALKLANNGRLYGLSRNLLKDRSVY